MRGILADCPKIHRVSGTQTEHKVASRVEALRLWSFTDGFKDINKWECILYVPDESIADYQEAAQWKEFFFIQDAPAQNPETLIEDVEETVSQEAIYYDLRGNRVANPANGLYIKVQDGHATKVRI